MVACSSSSLGSEGTSGQLDLTGLGAVWDGEPTLRTGGALFSEVSEKNLDLRTPSAHAPVLKPILVLMKENNKKLPSIDALREEVKAVYQLNKREIVSSEVDHAAWGLRKYAGFVKMKCRKSQPSNDSSRRSIDRHRVCTHMCYNHIDYILVPERSACCFGSQDFVFQELCLTLEPALQAWGSRVIRPGPYKPCKHP